jgi:hypothetical protein
MRALAAATSVVLVLVLVIAVFLFIGFGLRRDRRSRLRRLLNGRARLRLLFFWEVHVVALSYGRATWP